MLKLASLMVMVLGLGCSFVVKANSVAVDRRADEPSSFEDLNPFDPNIEEKLKVIDEDYEKQTGQSPFLAPDENAPDCYRMTCSVYAVVDKTQQKMFLYLKGQQIGEYLVSTGVPGYTTPDMDTHPNGRIYDAYTSVHFPGGDYNGLGNMPYAVFIQGGFAIHGTTQGNWPKLGHVASHGCIRLYPDNGKIFNRLVREYGVKDVWVTVD